MREAAQTGYALINAAKETTKDIIGFDGAEELDRAIDAHKAALDKTADILTVNQISIDPSLTRADQRARHEKPTPEQAERLEYLRGELRAERISYGELHELQTLALNIDPDDVELLEAAGVEEFPE